MSRTIPNVPEGADPSLEVRDYITHRDSPSRGWVFKLAVRLPDAVAVPMGIFQLVSVDAGHSFSARGFVHSLHKFRRGRFVSKVFIFKRRGKYSELAEEILTARGGLLNALFFIVESFE